ncbi:MAG: hypothetical protein CMB83_00990 [Flammeovirgaceae bacterium]|nr:hypothetical protein [Flammeovirgaceae bacterium]|tara:strand:- start:9445 stop:10158 length:714 start_codon:yes stop_codon:yes gene_type:complete
MSQFWEENLTEGYYDIITINGIKKNRGLRATWHNFTNLKVKDNISSSGLHLDYACGPGTLIGNYLDIESIGIDISRKQIEFASKKYKDKGLFVEIDKFKFQNYEKQFKTVTILGLLEFLNEEDITLLLNNIYNLLDDGGELILTTPNFKFGMNFLVNVQNIFGKYSYKETHISKFTKVKLSKLLENTKFASYEINKYMNLSVFIGFINLKLATKVQFILDKYFGSYFGFMLIAKLRK